MVERKPKAKEPIETESQDDVEETSLYDEIIQTPKKKKKDDSIELYFIKLSLTLPESYQAMAKQIGNRFDD